MFVNWPSWTGGRKYYHCSLPGDPQLCSLHSVATARTQVSLLIENVSLQTKTNHHSHTKLSLSCLRIWIDILRKQKVTFSAMMVLIPFTTVLFKSNIIIMRFFEAVCMKSAFMVQRPEKLFIHSDTGPPTGRCKDNDIDYSRSIEISSRNLLLILTLNLNFQPLAATFANPWIPRGIAGTYQQPWQQQNKILEWVKTKQKAQQQQ